MDLIQSILIIWISYPISVALFYAIIYFSPLNHELKSSCTVDIISDNRENINANLQLERESYSIVPLDRVS